MKNPFKYVNKRYYLLIGLLCVVITLSAITKVHAVTDTSSTTGGGQSALYNGVQIASDATLTRLSSSSFHFDWVKYQFGMTDAQNINAWVINAHNDGYSVLVSVAKNDGNIPLLGDPSPYTHQYCPYPEEMGVYDWDTTEPSGTPDPITHITPTTTVHHHQEEKDIWPQSTPNGYLQFRDYMYNLVKNFQNADQTHGAAIPDAIEIWNEPNLIKEWTDVGLGPVSPQNYANLLACGMKGARKAGYIGDIVSAGLAPEPDPSAGMDDQQFFYGYFDALKSIVVAPSGVINHAPPSSTYDIKTKDETTDLNAIGWHSDVTKNIPPSDPSLDGFQRYKIVYNKTTSIPIWLTEYGFKVNPDIGLTRDKQLQYVNDAYLVADTTSTQIQAMFLWNFGFSIDGVQSGPEYDDNILWDVENKSQLSCAQGNDIDIPQFNDAAYVTANSLVTTDSQVQKDLQAMAPPELMQQITDGVSQITFPTYDYLNVNIGFLRGIQGILDLLKALGCSAGISGFCPTDLVAGQSTLWATQNQKLSTDDQKKDTVRFVNDSSLADKMFVDPGISRTPANRDCNIAPDSTTSTKTTPVVGGVVNALITGGNNMINTISTELGTATGLFGSTNPPSLPGFDTCVSQAQKDPNINLYIGEKQFTNDQRGAEEYCEQVLHNQGLIPPGISIDTLPVAIP